MSERKNDGAVDCDSGDALGGAGRGAGAVVRLYQGQRLGRGAHLQRPALGALDRKLDGVFKAVSAKASGQMLATLRAEQRGWIGGRNECGKTQPHAPSSLTESWLASSVRECVEAQYKLRTAELQVTWRLLPPKPPVSFVCQNNPANEIVANFFDTDPPSARLERGDKTVTVYLVKSASGARYEGQNVRFWNKGQEASVWWLNVATGTSEQLECAVRR